jgi:cation:H+ antiporter
MAAAAWFTRCLEAICDRLELSAGALSMLGALGANIPNYVASIDAIAHGSTEVGLGIILGSNIYNIAIILGLATLLAPGNKGLQLAPGETGQVKDVAHYGLYILLATLLIIWSLPQTWLWPGSDPQISGWLPFIGLSLTLGIFAGLVWHILHRPHPAHLAQRRSITTHTTKRSSLLLLTSEAILALAIALGGVLVMVQTGQDLTTTLHMAPTLAGLLVLAVATSLPNTIVALILVRTGRAAACIEELFSSNSVNAALGIALPLCFWRQSIDDPLLLLLDAPLMLLLTCVVFLSIRQGKTGPIIGSLLLLSYIVWIGIHLFFS